jgi:hypothetical protein
LWLKVQKLRIRTEASCPFWAKKHPVGSGRKEIGRAQQGKSRKFAIENGGSGPSQAQIPHFFQIATLKM